MIDKAAYEKIVQDYENMAKERNRAKQDLERCVGEKEALRRERDEALQERDRWVRRMQELEGRLNRAQEALAGR